MSLVEGEMNGFLWTLFLSGLEFLYAENVNQTKKRRPSIITFTQEISWE